MIFTCLPRVEEGGGGVGTLWYKHVKKLPAYDTFDHRVSKRSMHYAALVPTSHFWGWQIHANIVPVHLGARVLLP
jgi:hypothetical protein